MRRLLIILLLALALPASAQNQFEWPEFTKNIQVLGDVRGEELGQIMRGFTVSLGVRCTYCHVGEAGQPLSTFDFASDDKPNKEIAREMVRMMQAIDEVMVKVKEPGEEKATVGCVNCHLGKRDPEHPAKLFDQLAKERAKGREGGGR